MHSKTYSLLARHFQVFSALTSRNAMKKYLILIIFALQGCGVYECIDMNFARKSRPIDKVFNVELEFQGRKMSKQVRCEEYYDAMCTERGNYWAMREVGIKSQYTVSTFQFIDNKLGEIEIPTPSCNDMVKGRTIHLKNLLPKISGETYWLISSSGDFRTYRATMPNVNPEKKVNINLTLKVNGVPIN